MEELDGYNEDLNIPKGFREVAQSIENFVRVNYETALSMDETIQPTPEDIAILKGKIQDIIRNNPPLKTILKYYRDAREDYLWYSDFYDDISKEDYHRYRTFTELPAKITPANYSGELAKIDLPYFKELVDLISLERLCMDYENKMLKVENKGILTKEIESDEKESAKSKSKKHPEKRTYAPHLNDKQYALLAECIEDIKLFRRPVKVPLLKNY